MARPREFDETEVIDLARDAFWCGGLSGTSIATLSEATGLKVGSIYKAFVDKEDLYRRTLDDYLERGLELAAAALGSCDSALEGIQAWLDQMAAQAAVDSPTCGCYAVLAAIELAGTDPDTRRRLRRHDAKLRAIVADRLRAADLAGDLDCDPDVGSKMLCAAVNGVQVEARKGITLADARSILALALRALRP